MPKGTYDAAHIESVITRVENVARELRVVYPEFKRLQDEGNIPKVIFGPIAKAETGVSGLTYFLAHVENTVNSVKRGISLHTMSVQRQLKLIEAKQEEIQKDVQERMKNAKRKK